MIKLKRKRVLSQWEIDELLSYVDRERRRSRARRKRREECQYERYADDWECEDECSGR